MSLAHQALLAGSRCASILQTVFLRYTQPNGASLASETPMEMCELVHKVFTAELDRLPAPAVGGMGPGQPVCPAARLHRGPHKQRGEWVL